MTSRIIKVGRLQQVITTTYSKDEHGRDVEHITLATPSILTDTQRLRLLSTWESDRKWRTS